jgi:uncharacterized protein
MSAADFLADVFELARTGAAIEGSLSLASALRLRAGLRHDRGALAFRLEGRYDERGRPAALLHLRGELPLVCDRCQQALELTLEHRAAFFFVRSEAELARLPVTDEPDEPLVGSRRFDVLALVEDEAILCVPISPRHAQCAAPLAVARAEDERRPFAALARLRGESKGG